MSGTTIWAITLDKDGKEVSKDLIAGIVDKQGFQKKDDGNYYKQLGDPRCISDEEMFREILEEEEKKKRKLLPPASQVWDDTSEFGLRHAVTQTADNLTNTALTKLDQITQSTPNGQAPEFVHSKQQICESRLAIYCSGCVKSWANNVITFKGPKLIRKIGVEALERRDWYAKLEANLIHKTIRVWYTDPDKPIPDLVIFDVLA